MDKEKLFKMINIKYNELLGVLNGTDIDKIKDLALEVHAMVHPAEISGLKEKTISDYVLDFMIDGNQNILVPREDCEVDLHYAGTNVVPICWQLWHIYRIEDLVSNILMRNKKQIFNLQWKEKIGSIIEDTGNALELDEAIIFGKGLNVKELRDYIIEVGKNTREIIKNLTLEEINSMVPVERIMRILEVGGVTTDFRSIWLLVYWGRLTIGEMILTPLTDHHMMHLPPCINFLNAKLLTGAVQHVE